MIQAQVLLRPITLGIDRPTPGTTIHQVLRREDVGRLNVGSVGDPERSSTTCYHCSYMDIGVYILIVRAIKTMPSRCVT